VVSLPDVTKVLLTADVVGYTHKEMLLAYAGSVMVVVTEVEAVNSRALASLPAGVQVPLVMVPLLEVPAELLAVVPVISSNFHQTVGSGIGSPPIPTTILEPVLDAPLR